MKIVKKLSIGFLALVVCFCSCFKFINAETIGNTYIYEYGARLYYVINDLQSFEGYEPIKVLVMNEEPTCYIQIGIDNDVYIAAPETSALSPLSSRYEGQSNGIDIYSFVLGELEILDGYSFSNDSEPIITLYDSLPNFEDVSSGFSVYDTIYDLIETYIFGGNIVLGSHQDLTATTLSSIVCILVFALPFLIIWKVLKVIMG